MSLGLQIKIVDPDEHYLGIEISASNGRFAGTTRIYAGLNQLSEFANSIDGFPSNPTDKRRYEFGTSGSAAAGGHVKFLSHCTDGAGRAAIEVEFEDDPQLHSCAIAHFGFSVHPADVDRFVQSLRKIEKNRIGTATLPVGV